MMSKKLLSLLVFGVLITALVAALKLVNWVPSALQEGALRKYGSIDEVKAKLKITDVFAPAYYPQCFSWPPSQIAAQTRPYTAVVMEFNRKDSREACLIISQVASPHVLPEEKIKLTRVAESVRYQLRGRDALLEVGVCEENIMCSRISWNEKGYRISVAMKSAPVDLIRIAESMTARPGK
ncbi:MAG: hypothetical protein AABZ10_13755 [Nitrospirota bacterium]